SIRSTALFISFIRKGSWRSSSEGLKNFLACSKVFIPRCARREAIGFSTPSTPHKCSTTTGSGLCFSVQRMLQRDFFKSTTVSVFWNYSKEENFEVKFLTQLWILKPSKLLSVTKKRGS